MPKPSTTNSYDQDDFDQIVKELREQVTLLDAAKAAKKKADKLIKARAKQLGIPVSPLNSALAAEAGFLRLVRNGEGVKDEHQETYAAMTKRLLGDLADTPLGQAAMKAVDGQVDKALAKKKPNTTNVVGFEDRR